MINGPTSGNCGHGHMHNISTQNDQPYKRTLQTFGGRMVIDEYKTTKRKQRLEEKYFRLVHW
jgi:hypothetical protein